MCYYQHINYIVSVLLCLNKIYYIFFKNGISNFGYLALILNQNKASPQNCIMKSFNYIAIMKEFL